MKILKSGCGWVKRKALDWCWKRIVDGVGAGSVGFLRMTGCCIAHHSYSLKERHMVGAHHRPLKGHPSLSLPQICWWRELLSLEVDKGNRTAWVQLSPPLHPWFFTGCLLLPKIYLCGVPSAIRPSSEDRDIPIRGPTSQAEAKFMRCPSNGVDR